MNHRAPTALRTPSGLGSSAACSIPLRRVAGVVVGLGMALAWMVLDATHRRAASARRAADARVVVRLLGTADMVLSSSSRWLRHPSLSEPGAPFADGLALMDIDPAGAMIGPPIEVLAGALRGTEARFKKSSTP